MAQTNFRDATADEIRLIGDLASKILPAEFKGILSSDEIDSMVERMYSQEVLQNSVEQGMHFIIASCDGKDIGFASFVQEGPDLFYISRIFVTDEYRDRGVGAALFKELIREIKLFHPSPCTAELLVNHSSSALNFYHRMGMEFSREVLFDLDSFELAEQILSIKL